MQNQGNIKGKFGLGLKLKYEVVTFLQMAYMTWARGKKVALAKLLKKNMPRVKVSCNMTNMAPSTHACQRLAFLSPQPWIRKEIEETLQSRS